MIYFFIKKNRKILKNKDLEIQELNNLFKIDKEKYLLDKISREDELKNDFNSSIEIINNKIKEYQINSHNLKKAIEIFESKSLTFFEAKFIPFKSLNKARVGSIIRVHKYSKKLETDIQLEIIEDFPVDYMIENILDEADNIKYSFLAKVKSKFKNKMILSRVEAYY